MNHLPAKGRMFFLNYLAYSRSRIRTSINWLRTSSPAVRGIGNVPPFSPFQVCSEQTRPVARWRDYVIKP